MAKAAYKREIDRLGRLVIPKQYRDELDLPEEGGEVNVTCHGGVIYVTKAATTCVFCRSRKDLLNFKGKPVCRRCLASIRQNAEEKPYGEGK